MQALSALTIDAPRPQKDAIQHARARIFAQPGKVIIDDLSGSMTIMIDLLVVRGI